MGEIRDAARTRARIMEAARDEFAARGFAGARMAAIAERAGIVKQLLYHYFASKDVLFEATVASKFEQHRAALPELEGPGAAFVRQFRAAYRDAVWIRLMTWEAATNEAGGRMVGEDVRREATARQTANIAARQASGELPADLPTELLQLAIYALGIFPVAFPQSTEMITGRTADDPAFQTAWTEFLAELARRLALAT